MLKKTTFERVTEVFRSVFEDAELVIAEETTSDDIKNWDSLNNVKLLISLEKEFAFRFNSSEITGLLNVGALISVIENKLV